MNAEWHAAAVLAVLGVSLWRSEEVAVPAIPVEAAQPAAPRVVKIVRVSPGDSVPSAYPVVTVRRVGPADYRSGSYRDEEFPRGPTPEEWNGQYVYYPEERSSWRQVHLGITLVLVAILVYLVNLALTFIAFSISASGALGGESSLMPIGSVCGLATRLLTLIGYGLCISVPERTMARSWAIIALALNLTSLLPALLTLPVMLGTELDFLAFIAGHPYVLVLLVGVEMMIAFSSWMSYLMFLERVAEVFNERGIADSVNGGAGPRRTAPPPRA